MAKKILIRNKTSGITRNGYLGYSWTCLFFGFWVPLLRGEMVAALLHFIFSSLTLGLWHIVMSFVYNRQSMTRMLSEHGWELADDEETNRYARQKLGIVAPRH